MHPRRHIDPVILGLGVAALLVVGALAAVALILLVRAPAQAPAIGSLFAAAGGLVGTIAAGLVASRYGKQAVPDPPEGGALRLSVESGGMPRTEILEQIERRRRLTPPPIPVAELEGLDAVSARVEERTIPGHRRPDPSGRTLSYGESLARRGEDRPARTRRATGAQRLKRDE